MKGSPHYLGHRQRLRRRFEKSGFSGFAPHEVIELLLTLAIPRKDVKEQAKALLARFGSLRGVLDAPVEDLREVAGLGEVAPLALKIIKDAASQYLQEQAEEQPCLLEPEALATFWRARLGPLHNEVVEVAYLNSAYRLLREGVETLHEGTLDRAVVYPRRVIESALRRRAAAVVLAHNHPNGVIAPSQNDIALTKALVLAAAPLDLKVHDHLVVSTDEVFSFRREGLL